LFYKYLFINIRRRAKRRAGLDWMNRIYRISRMVYPLHPFGILTIRRIHEKRSRRRTRISRMTRIRADRKICLNPIIRVRFRGELFIPRGLAACGAAPVEARRGGGWGLGRGGRGFTMIHYRSEMMLIYRLHNHLHREAT